MYQAALTVVLAVRAPDASKVFYLKNGKMCLGRRITKERMLCRRDAGKLLRYKRGRFRAHYFFSFNAKTPAGTGTNEVREGNYV